MRAIVLIALAGCAWQDGVPMGTAVLTFEARWATFDDRDAGDGWQRLASDYELRVEAASAELGVLALVDTGAGEVDDGHGHDHGATSPAVEGEHAVLEQTVGPRTLIPGGAVVLDCGGGCVLPAAEIGRIELAVSRLDLAGRVRDTRDPPRIDGEVAWTLALARGDGPPVAGAIDLPIDRGHAPDVALTVAFAPGAPLFDEVRFDEAGEAIDEDAAAVAAIEDALAGLGLELAATRR